MTSKIAFASGALLSLFWLCTGTLCCVVYGAAMLSRTNYLVPAITLDAIGTRTGDHVVAGSHKFIGRTRRPYICKRDLKSLRTGNHVRCPLPDQGDAQSDRRDGHSPTHIAYGQTERRRLLTQTHVETPLDLRVETVGRPLPGVEVKTSIPPPGQSL